MKKILAAFIGIVLIGTIIVAVVLSSEKQNGKSSFETAIVKKRNINSSILATGSIKPMVGAEVKVGARLSGKVEHLYANIGDKIEKGQVIAKLEQDDLTAKVNEAKMNLQVSEANLELMQKKLQRIQSLYKRDLVSKEDVDVAERDCKATQAQVNLIKETIKYNETQLSYATIIAPISGIIASVSTQEGETVAAGLNAPTFVTIIDLSRLQVDTFVDETDIGRVAISQTATFTVDAYPDKDFSGKVIAIYPKAIIQQNVVYYDVVIAITNTEGLLKPDMTASVIISAGNRDNVLSVPNKSVKRESEQKVVYILQGDKPIRKAVKTGWKDSNFTEILEGVAEGETVIIGETGLSDSQ
ncbi:MAG: efflux RND transporter periplasmic adaptor subunit [Planctomycetes bacterium]|nr:efflux RND transporter periplasmic adaptor subunit [Planctomycetota bacterium]